MTRAAINHGTTAGDGTGETLFSAFDKVNQNDSELYGAKTEFAANFAALPAVGEVGKIYITLDDDAMYRWTGTVYDDLGGIQFVANAAALPAVGEAGKLYVAADTGGIYQWLGSAYAVRALVPHITGGVIDYIIDPLTGTKYAALPLDINGYPIVNLIPRRNTLANLLATAGGVGEISEATDWSALVLHNGVVGGAKVLYCEPKRCHVISSTPQAAITGVPLPINFSVALDDPYGLWVAGTPNQISVPAGATRVRMLGNVGFAANPTGNRDTYFADQTGSAINGRVSAAAAAGVMQQQCSAYYELTDETAIRLYAVQNSGGNLNVGGYQLETSSAVIEFWVD